MITKRVTRDNGMNVDPGKIPLIIQTATQFTSKIYTINAGAKANAKSLLSMMSFLAGVTDSVEIMADGEDETQAIEAMANILCNQ